MKKEIIFFLIIITGIAFPQENELPLLSSVREKFNTIDDFRMNYTQSGGTAGSFQGSVLYKNPGKVRITAGDIILSASGSTSWNYNKKEDKLIISTVEDDEFAFYDLRGMLFDLPDECAVSEEGNTIILVPNENGAYGFNKVIITVRDDALIEKVLIVDTNGSKVITQFTGYRLNEGIDDSEFTLSPKEGTKVIDLR